MAIRKKSTKKAVRKPVRHAKSAPKKSTRKSVSQPRFLRIGDRCSKEGGVFMGIAKGEDGQPDSYLYRGRYAEKRMTHAAALKFAAACRDGGHQDWTLPDRTAGALLYANGRDDMRAAWHWLEHLTAGDDAYAWCQLFRFGLQGSSHKDDELEVVLVRRAPIQ